MVLDQIALLRTGDLDALDRDNLAQYLTEMTIRDRRELESRLVILLQPMLKFMVEPDHGSRGWAATVVEQQGELAAMLKATPSLKAYTPTLFADAYPRAIRLAASETGILREAFPSDCPWTMEQTMEQTLGFEPPKVA